MYGGEASAGFGKRSRPRLVTIGNRTDRSGEFRAFGGLPEGRGMVRSTADAHNPEQSRRRKRSWRTLKMAPTTKDLGPLVESDDGMLYAGLS
jgi:hypothetical protein